MALTRSEIVYHSARRMPRTVSSMTVFAKKPPLEAGYNKSEV